MTFSNQAPQQNQPPIGQPQPQPNKYQDDQAAYILEIFFGYIQKKMRVFNKAMENETLLSLSQIDKRFAKIPTPDLQDTLQKITLLIGEKALSKKNDQRMKNLFFSVFVTCIKYTKSSQIVPYYFSVIRNLFKVLCNLSDNSNFVKEFIPMIQGLLETFLQAKEEASFIKETNEICYSVPAKLKNLIEYLPIISRPLIDSMKSNNIELIESGINTIQMWVSALASYPEILDPVIANILPELNTLLYRILYLLPNYTFKLLGKLGAKSRLYYEDKEFKSKNYPEDGLKIELQDRNSGRQIKLGIDSAIDVVLLKIFDSFQKYSQPKLLESFKLVKSSFLCFIEADIDIDYLVTSIINAKNKNTDLLTAYAFNSTKYFDSKKPQIKNSALGKGSESHAFEKILKCLLMACSFPKNNPETQVVHQKVKKFFKWVTQYFTLIYICKNGKLKENLINEISPLIFIENICDFIYYNMLQGIPKLQQRTYYKGAVYALKTMIRMVKEIYGDEDDQIYENLEFLQILIQKICHLSYGQDLPKKVASNIALQIIIKELPKRTVKLHWQSFLDSLFHILNTNNESLVFQVEKECKITLDKFFDKVGIYKQNILNDMNEGDKDFFVLVMDKLFQNLHQNKFLSRNVAMYFIEMISRKTGHSVLELMTTIQRAQIAQQIYHQPGQPQAQQPDQQDKSWSFFLSNQIIEKQSKSLFSLFKSGYSQVLNLISYLDLLQFLIKHKIIEPFKKIHIYLAICEQLLKILEDEVEKSESRNDNLTSFNNDPSISNAAKAAVKYMKLEKHYISQNKSYDPYSHTLHPHHFLQNQHFEVEELAKRDKLLADIDSVQYSYNFFEIFQPRFQTYEQVNPRATEQMQAEELAQFKTVLQQRITDHISKMFSPSIRASDISFDYVHHIYELYPNLKLHTDLICKCLSTLCDISTDDKMHIFFKERQQAFFDQQQAGFPGQQPQQQPVPQPLDGGLLGRRIDLYAVEIKSKIIASYFKFFQREEKNVYKTAKKCLQRILKKEVNQQEALPNQILKECVRPSLNILSQRTSFPALYEQLTRLINVLHGCFNEQLGRHLIRCYETNKEKVLQDFQLNMNMHQNQGPDGTNPENNPDLTPEQQIADRQRKYSEDYEKLILQQNIKIEDLEIAHHIIKILYLLPTSRNEIYRILTQIPDFEYNAIQELESKFESAHQRMLQHYQAQPIYSNEQNIRPISIRLGILKSDFRIGLAKFYNKNPFESLDIFKSLNSLTTVMLDILNEPSSYCLRERVSREPDIIKQYLITQIDTQEFDTGIKLVSIFLKYNSNYLTLQPNQIIVDILRKQWIKLADCNLDDLLVKSQNQPHIRRCYYKIQSCLLTYCRSPKSKVAVLFELLRGYRYQALIDQSAVKLFFQFEVPNTFSLRKKKDLLQMTLDRLKIFQTTQASDEQKFITFELAFMPNIIKHSGSQASFKELMSDFLQEFIETFFGTLTLIQNPQGQSVRIPMLETLRNNLDVSQQVSYEQFQFEIIKVVSLLFEHFEFQQIQAACPQREVTRITNFLYQCAKKANNSALKEWAFFTLTQLFTKILDINNEQNLGDNQVMNVLDENLLQNVSQSSEQILMMILQHSQNLQVKALVHKAFSNLIKIFKDRRVLSYCPQQPISYSHSQQPDYVSTCLKRALIFEGRNTASIMYLSSFLLGHQDAFYPQHQQFIGRMYKVIIRFGAQLHANLPQKQMVVELSAVIIGWVHRRLQNQHIEGRIADDQIAQYKNMFTNILFYIIKTCVMIQIQPTDSLKEVIDLSNHCLRQIIQLVRVFPNFELHFPFFERFLTTEGSDKENLKIIKMAILNVSYILIKYQRQIQRFKEFFFENIVDANTKYQKGILFVCKILLFIISSNQDASQQNDISAYVKRFLSADLKRCLDEDIVRIAQKIKELEDRYSLMERKPPMLACQEAAGQIFNAIPHFSIRLLCAIQQEQIDNVQMPSVKYTDNEFQFLKDLAQAIFRVVGYFRKNIIFDQNDLSPLKIRTRHNVVWQPINSQTVYTPKELVQLKDDIVELKQEEQNIDLFNKETIMMGLLYLVQKIKKMKQEESIQIFGTVQLTIQTLLKFNINEYMLEWLRKVLNVLIEDQPDDITKLLMDQKASLVFKMLQKITEIQAQDKKESASTNQLIEGIFEQAVKFLETQPTMFNDHISRVFEKVFVSSKGKSVELKQRLYKVFEKLNGNTLFKKLQYFFSKQHQDDLDKVQFMQSQSQLLDFTLFNFKIDVPLKKTQYSSRLFPLFNLSIMFDNQIELKDVMRPVNSEYGKVKSHLSVFQQKMAKFKNLKLSSLMNPLSEIISINPSHSTDKLISDKLFIKVFWQYWNLMTRQEQQYLSDNINQFFKNTIPLVNNADFRKNSFPKTFLESIASLSPQIRIEPEILQYLGKNLNLWHVTIPILENQIVLFPENERYIFSLNELYLKLGEDDYIAGLRRMATDSDETRSLISYGQHQMWEEINQQFSHYIIYYAEQEGLYNQMDREYNMPGKYQRQIPHATFTKLKDIHVQNQIQRFKTDPAQTEILEEQDKLERTLLEAKIEGVVSQSIDNQQQFPKEGPNNKVKEVDLRIWETLFIESLKVLNKWDQYRDIAHALNNQEMMIEYLWNVKDWRSLAAYETILKKSESIKYQLYYIYLIIHQQQIGQFDEIFKQVIQLSYKEWDQSLPNYVDNIQFENLIMFQLVMESSEGGRNMIKEYSNVRQRGRLADLKTAINIWRERVPHQCESIQMWKEILENRNFIQNQISHMICPINIPNISGQTAAEVESQKLVLEKSRQQFVNEYLDIAWNYYKLAQVSRKQGLPSLSLLYISHMKNQVQVSTESDGVKYEKFKQDSEYLKLIMQFNNNPQSINQQINEFYHTKLNNQDQINSQSYEPWQTAELYRMVGQFSLKIGKLDVAQKMITKSIELNKKEAKTWMTYAKLNQTVFDFRKDVASLQNMLKGYLSAIVLNLPKSRLIIPLVLKSIKRRDLTNQAYASLVGFMKINLEQMPTWIWIFWIPQIVNIFYSSHNHIELCVGTKVLEKLCKLYPQAIYYPLKLKSQFFPDEQLLQTVNFLFNHIKRAGFQIVGFCDRIQAEFYKNLKSTADEELHIVLTKILCMSQFFKIDNFESDFQGFLEQINQKFFREDNIVHSELMRELKPIFLRDFRDETTRERDSIELIRRLKNLKDFLHKKLSLTEMKINLEQVSPYLANFNEKGVELPGQHLISEQEPVPQNTIYIQKFEPVIYRTSVTKKKIVIKGSNSKVYSFTLNHIQSKEDYAKHCSEERVLQIKMIMNQIFQKHKETLRRGIKFYVPIKVLMFRSKLSQDDLQFADLQEIHDYLFQERGLDFDLALNLQIQKVEDIFKEYGEGQERILSSISQEKKRIINEETFNEMKAVYCQPYLLSSFFHRIFYNVDDLFIFKKQFTTYHAVNSFFSYIFSQVEYSTLNQISFCKTSGRLNFNDAKLVEFLKNKYLKIHIQNSNNKALDFNDLEKDEMHALPYQGALSSGYLPFRLTNNLVDFIGKIGLNGLFAGVMTSCSMAVSKENDKFMPLLQIVYRDELNDQKESMVNYINHCVDYMKHKITSLSQNKTILNLDFFEAEKAVFKNEAPQEQQPDQPMKEEEDFIMFGQFKIPKSFLKYEMEKPTHFEEFNKKVFDLIDIATDEKRLCQMPANWNAWF